MHGTGFYVILEGEAPCGSTGPRRNRLARGEFFGEISLLLKEPPVADIVALTPLRCLVLHAEELEDTLVANPGCCTGCSSPKPGSSRTRTCGGAERAGGYPVVVVGSGPGGLQVSACLREVGIDHVVLSADEAPAGMFQRFPFFQRLITWTKPYAPAPGVRRHEWFDWNSLLSVRPVAPGAGGRGGRRDLGFPSRPRWSAASGLRVEGGAADPVRGPMGGDPRLDDGSWSWRRPRVGSVAAQRSSRSG